MPVVVEPVEHLYAAVAAPGIVLGKLLEDVDLQLGRLPVLLDVLDYFERNDLVLVDVPHLDHLPERALSERGEDFEAVLDEVPVRIDQVSILVILDDRPLAVVPVVVAAAGAAGDRVVVAEAAVGVPRAALLLLVSSAGGCGSGRAAGIRRLYLL